LRQRDESTDLSHFDIVTYAPGFEPWVEPFVGVEESIVERSVPVSPKKKQQNDSGYSEGSCGDFDVSEQHDQTDFEDSSDSDNDVIIIGEISSSFLTEDWQDNKRNVPPCLIETVNVRDSIAKAVDDGNVGNSVEIIENVTEDSVEIVDDLEDSVEIIDEPNDADSGRQNARDNVDEVNIACAVSVKESVEDDPYVIYRELKRGKINTSRDNIIMIYRRSTGTFRFRETPHFHADRTSHTSNSSMIVLYLQLSNGSLKIILFAPKILRIHHKFDK
jgi:hypothetical protein